MMIFNDLANKNFYLKYPLIILLFLVTSSGTISAQIGNAACNVQEPWIIADYSSLSVSITDDVPEGIGVVICAGSISNEQNIIGSPTDFASISMTGLACEAEFSVVDAVNEYPIGTFAGFKIGTAKLLADATIGAKVTISTYNNGNPQESYIAVSSSIGIDQDLIGSDGLATIGFITTKAFDEIRIEYDALIALLFQAQVYHPVIQKFCSGTDTPCNEITTISSPAHPLAISPERTGPTGACVICTVSNTNNVVNADQNDFATLNVTVGIVAGAELSVKNQIDNYPAGTYAGFDIANSTLLDAGVLDNITIRTYLDGNSTPVEIKSGGNQLATVGSNLLGASGRRIVGFVATQEFDEVQIEFSNLVTADVGSTDVYGLVIQRFCAGPALGCNELNAIASPEYPLYINPEKTGLLSGVCALCGVDEPQNVINTDGSDHAEINLTVGVLSEVGLSVRNQIDVYPANTYAGFDVRNTGLLDATLLDQITINTYLYGTLVESKSGKSELVSAQTSLLTPSERKTIGFIGSAPFNEVQIIVENLVAVDLGDVEIYGVIFSQFCDIEIICDTTYFLTNTNFPVIIDYFKTGTDGLLCAGNSVINTKNAINSDTTNYATINVTAGAECPASLAVLDALHTFPIGSKAGFVIEVSDELFLNLGVGLFDNITVETYLDGDLQESSTGVSNLLDVELIFLYVNDIEGRFNVGFQTTKGYDEVRIVVTSLVGVTNRVDVYSAFVDTRGAIGPSFDCCPVIAPALSANTLSNVCDVKTVNLNALETSTAPNNTTLVWFTTDRPSGNAYATPTQATAGSYYAYYYDSNKNCYTPASEEVVVTITLCADMQIGIGVDDATPEVGDTVTFTITITNNGPDGATNVMGFDTLPAGYIYVSSETMTGAYNPITGLWDVGSLALNESVVLTIKAKVAFIDDYNNDVHVTADEPDKDNTNNHASTPVTPMDPCDPAGQAVDIDCDSDGLTNNEELSGIDDPNTTPDPNGFMTDPDDPDSDGDGVSDGDEAIDGTNPNNPCDFNPESVTLTPDTAFEQLDCDGDGVTNIDELGGKDGNPITLEDNTDMLDPCDFNLVDVSQNATSTGDCDGDGVTDADEINGLDSDYSTSGDNTNSLDPCDFNIEDQGTPGAGWLLADCDGDGVTNGDEYVGLDDDAGTAGDNTNPLDPCDYNVADQGIPSAVWLLADCDGDGVINGDEYAGLDNDPLTPGDNTNPLDPCSLNLADVSQNATSTDDCDGDGVTNADEINGSDNDYSTAGNNTDPNNPCDFNSDDISGTVTADQNNCNHLYAMNDINVTIINISVAGDVLTNDNDPEYDDFEITEIITGNLINPSPGGSAILLPSGNSLLMGINGHYVFTPVGGFTGEDNFSYVICDEGQPEKCDTAKVVINVSPLPLLMNNGPIANDDNGHTPNDEILTGNVMSNDDDIDGDAIHVSQVLTQPSNGTITINANGDYTYTPDNGFVGKDTVEYEICDDGTPSECDNAILTIVVTEADDENETYCNDDSGMGWSNSTIIVPILANDTDPEGDALSIPEIISGPAHGTYVVNADKTVTYTPTSEFFGNDQLVYKVCDNGTPSVCDTATVYFTVFQQMCFTIDLRVYLEGALKSNGNAMDLSSNPLMRDDLRSSPFTDTLGTNFIPVTEPYTALANFTHVGGGGNEVADAGAFNDRGQNSVVDWVFLEFRNRLNGGEVEMTRSAFLQRDGDIVDVDGISPIEFCGLTNAFHYIAVRHRNHLGVMTNGVENLSVNGVMVDFGGGNSGLSGVFDFGIGHPVIGNTYNYAGMAMNTFSGTGNAVKMMWAGNANGDSKVKYQAPGDDLFKVRSEVLFHKDNVTNDFNYDKGYGYFQGDVNLNSKVKFQAPFDDSNTIFSQLLYYPLNTTNDYNFNVLIEQLMK